MTISYYASDPTSTAEAPLQEIQPSPDRPRTRSGFTVQGLPGEAVFQPGSAGFIAWQVREAALRTIDAYEAICGVLPAWAGSRSKRLLQIVPDGGDDINAYYDRVGLEFFHCPLGRGTMHTGASAEVVSHEAGHAILDAIRPELWNTVLPEVAAFHEGFGDCMAIMLGLSERSNRLAVFAGNGPGKANFIETMGEQIAQAIKQAYGPAFNASGPRHGLNTFQWDFPESLPLNGRPGTLINESHSLGQLASGIYYDLICAIFAASSGSGSTGGEAELWAACQTATKLICFAAARAPIKARFYESWGRTMLAIDTQEMRGANDASIRTAFQQHNITLSATAMLQPRARVTRKSLGASGGGKSVVPTEAREAMRSILNVAEGEELSVREVRFGDQRVAEVAGRRAIDLSGLSERLAGVKALVTQSALLGEAARGTAMLGGVEADAVYAEEVRNYVATLVKRGAIAFDAGDVANSRGSGYVVGKGAHTHAVKERDGQRVLERIAFACGPAHCSEG